MTQAKKGDSVKISFKGKLSDGTVFADTAGGEPLEFTLGEGRIIPGLETAIEGMDQGQSKSVTIPAEQAYGPRRDELIEKVGKDQFPENLDPQVGQRFEIPQQKGNTMVVSVIDVSDDVVTLDGNHPLAGEELTFDVELVEVAG